MVIPSGLIPPGGKSAIDKILFIPNKYGGFFRLVSLLLNVYRRDRQSFSIQLRHGDGTRNICSFI